MLAFRIKQYLKMFIQKCALPLVYNHYRRQPIIKNSVIFADAHHNTLPFSMQLMHEELERMGYPITDYILDFGQAGFIPLIRHMVSFMKAYARAETVFICDYYLPATACRKKAETRLVQLWHSCGLLKKYAYDASDDIPAYYKGSMFSNYTCMTVSAPNSIPVQARALRLPENRIVATGVSRTDIYFDPEWNERCKKRFFGQYPEARQKKIALWAPTFRGNAAHPTLEGFPAIKDLISAMQDEGWYFIIKAHPHLERHLPVSNCVIPTEELLPVADLLITDYSSVLFDYLVYQKPLLLFAPDLAEYEQGRGFYIDYRSLPGPVATTSRELMQKFAELTNDWFSSDKKRLARQAWLDNFYQEYMCSCDGHATRKILEYLSMDPLV